MNTHWKMLLATAFCTAVSWQPAVAQTPTVAILEVDIENSVRYTEDVSDPPKFGTLPGPVSTVPTKNLTSQLQLGDIVAVNGQPVKGTASFFARGVGLVTGDTGVGFFDAVRTALKFQQHEILKLDGTAIGTIMTIGSTGGSPAPGSPVGVMSGNQTIIGGTGAFLGVRGQMGETPAVVSVRGASMLENPANRRTNGGGKGRAVFVLIPMFVPQIAIVAGSPAIFHADFSPITAAKPAKAGETLIVQATGLGPTVPGINLGQPFPLDAVQTVNSPLAVSVNGKPADVINGIGWPGQVNTYRVDFRFPDGVPSGSAAIQLTAAWIPGSAVTIPVQ
jgi:hypothetical protein